MDYPKLSEGEFAVLSLATCGVLGALAWTLKQYRLRAWPKVVGHVANVSVQIGGYAPSWRRDVYGKDIWNAVIEYVYTAKGEKYRDVHTLGFTDKRRAQQYANQFRKGMTVEVHCSWLRKKKTVLPLPGQDWIATDEGPAAS